MKRRVVSAILFAAISFFASAQQDINEPGPSGRTQLCEAVRQKRIPLISSLLANGANVNAKSSDGTTALHWAALGHLFTAEGWEIGDAFMPKDHAISAGIAQTLLAAGADVNALDDQGSSPLMLAAETEDTQIATVLLKYSPRLDQQDSTGRTALFRAALASRRENQSLLLDAGANIRLKSKAGDTAFLAFCGAAGDNLDLLKQYLAKGATVTERDADGRTPLNRIASLYGPVPSLLQCLIDAGSDVNTQDNRGNTPLMGAIDMDIWKFPAVDVLLKAKANVNLANKAGETPLIKLLARHGELADRETNADMVNVLVAAGAKVNVADATGTTPLMCAVGWNSELVVRLLDLGADANAKNAKGRIALELAFNDAFPNFTSLDMYLALLRKTTSFDFRDRWFPPAAWAIEHGSLEIVDLLVRLGLPVESRSVDRYVDGSTMLLCATAYNQPEIVKYLLEKKANPNAKGSGHGFTPLMFASSRGDVESVRLLLKAKASVNAATVGGDCALGFAIQQGSDDIVKLLISSKADVNAIADRGSMLTLAVGGESMEIVQMLLDAKANPNTKERTTPLMFAVESGDTRYVDLLIKAKANVNVKNMDGQTALEVARSLGYRDIIDSLVKAGAK